MPMSDYIRSLRARIGTDILEIPAVSVILTDERGRMLLVRHVEGNDWTTPGGMVEPFETPADAAVRETWEETGLYVRPTRIVGVFGGPRNATTYANGDRIAWVSTVFAAERIDGELQPDGVETLEARYFAWAELADVRLKPHLVPYLEAARAEEAAARFEPPVWTPSGS